MLIGKPVKIGLLEEEDLPLLVTWRNTPAIWACFFNKRPLSRAGQRSWFEDLLSDQSKKLFIICAIESGEPIGTIGLDHIDYCNQSVELGNILVGDEGSLGKGYAKEAVKLILFYCFLRLNMNRVYLEVYADNLKAIKLYECYNFKVEGRLRKARFDGGDFKDVLIMSILRTEFVPF